MIGQEVCTIMEIQLNFFTSNHSFGTTKETLKNNILESSDELFTRDEIANKTLGSQACEMLLQEIKPKYWFSAHLHVRFAATLRHNENQATEFLALDKCLPRRKYLEVHFEEFI